MMINLIIFFVFIIGLFYIMFRFLKNPTYELLNPIFYLLLMSLFYLLLASLFSSYVFMLFHIQCKTVSIYYAKYLFLYNIFIYFIYFISIKPRRIRLNKQFKFSKISLLVMNMYLFIILSLGMFLILKYSHSLLLLIDNRVVAHEKYLSIISTLPLNQIFMTSLIFSLLLYITKKNIFYFVPSITLAIFPLFAGSRTYFVMFIFTYVIGYGINYPKKVKKLVFLLVPLLLLLMSMWIFIKNIEITSLIQLFYSVFAEFAHTAITTSYVIDNKELYNKGDLLEYYAKPLLKIVANSQINLLQLNQPYFADIISDKIGKKIGFAGNNVTEALYYGGFLFAFVYPFLIVTFLSLFTHKKLFGNLFNLIFLVMILIYFRALSRGAFYEQVVSLFYFIIPIGFVLFNDIGKKILIVEEKAPCKKS